MNRSGWVSFVAWMLSGSSFAFSRQNLCVAGSHFVAYFTAHLQWILNSFWLEQHGVTALMCEYALVTNPTTVENLWYKQVNISYQTDSVHM